MQVRCPGLTCGFAFEITEETTTAVRCPRCGLSVMLPERRDSGNEQIQASFPSLSLDGGTKAPPAKKPIDLEQQIYDGLPPLSVMLALRSRQGGTTDDDADLDIRRQMTAEDWQALAAFETVLHAAAALKTAVMYGIIALVCNLFVWMVEMDHVRNSAGSPGWHLLSLWVSLLILAPGFYLMLVGGDQLSKVQIDGFVELLPWSTLCVALVFVVHVLLNLMQVFSNRYANVPVILALVSVPFSLIAAFDTGKASLRVWTALRQVHSAEVLGRLTEAMMYLK